MIYALLPCIFLMVWVVVGNIDLIGDLKKRNEKRRA